MQSIKYMAIHTLDMEHGTAAATMYDPAARAVTPDDAVSCSALATMSKANAPAARTAGMTVESRDELERLPYDRYELGVDGDGTVHFHSPRADRIVELAAGGAASVDEAYAVVRDRRPKIHRPDRDR